MSAGETAGSVNIMPQLSQRMTHQVPGVSYTVSRPENTRVASLEMQSGQGREA